MTDLRAAAQQALEALEFMEPYLATEVRTRGLAITALRAALAEPEPPPEAQTEAEKIAYCAGWWDALAKAREAALAETQDHFPDVTKMVQEPVALEVRCDAHPKWLRVEEQQFTEYVSFGWEGRRLYAAPPQRKPLTDEGILAAVGWERAEMYMKLTPNFPVAEAKKETLKNARAIEQAHGIGSKT